MFSQDRSKQREFLAKSWQKHVNAEILEPLASLQSYPLEEFPPLAKATADPSEPGTHVSLIVITESSNSLSGSPTSAKPVATQPAASVTLRLYIPANKPDGDAPPGIAGNQLYVVRPTGCPGVVTLIAPFGNPSQVALSISNKISNFLFSSFFGFSVFQQKNIQK